MTFFLGDAVDYCAFPNECVERVEEVSDIKLFGNHEACILGMIDEEYFTETAKQSLRWTKKVLSSSSIEKISSWDLTNKNLYGCWESVFSHSSYSSPDSWEYIFGQKEAKKEFEKTSKESPGLVFIGHTHSPAVYLLDDSVCHSVPCSKSRLEIDLKPGLRYIVNVGSSGQPRDGIYMPSYAVLDTQKNSVIIDRFDYNAEDASNEIIKRGLPKNLAMRILTGT